MSLDALTLWSERMPLIMTVVSVSFVVVEWLALALVDRAIASSQVAPCWPRRWRIEQCSGPISFQRSAVSGQRAVGLLKLCQLGGIR